jgi:hypothetical protein
MKFWKTGSVILGIMVILAIITVVFINRPMSGVGVVPQFIQADFIDLDKVFSISKFRSGSGHDFSGNGEQCRSMKHYFNTQENREKLLSFEKNNGIPPKPDGINDISIYSPVDGKIAAVTSEQMPIGQQVYIRPNSNYDYTVRLFHVYLDSGIKKGSKVAAGQKIGVISHYQNTDIAIMGGGFGENFISYFDVMPDSVFAKYRARGVKNRDELIISKEVRDADPLTCNGEMFARETNNVDSRDFVFLSGYISPNSISF